MMIIIGTKRTEVTEIGEEFPSKVLYIINLTSNLKLSGS